MAEDRPTTPEKQLLKLIEDPKNAAGPSPSSRPGRLSAPGAGRFSLSALRGLFAGRLSFWKRDTQKKISGARLAVDLSWVNRLLYVAIGCLLVYAVFDASASAINLKKSANFAFQKERSSVSRVPNVISPLKEAAYYLQKVNSRDIFKEGPKRQTTPVEAKAQPIAAPVNEAFQSLSLVGISWSANPDVIIEDKAKTRTYFVKRGQTVGDGVKVEAVFKDHVILSFEGQEFELR